MLSSTDTAVDALKSPSTIAYDECRLPTHTSNSEVGETSSAVSVSTSSKSMKTNRDVEGFLRKTTPFDYNKQTGDTNQVQCLISALRESLLTHRWKQANSIMGVLSHYSIWMVRDYTWKCGAELMFRHPDSNPDNTNLFFRKVQTSNYYHCRQKLMEKVFHLLHENRLEEAYEAIQEKVGKAGIKTKWEKMLEQEWKIMVSAYTGLLQYAQWTQRIQSEDDVVDLDKTNTSHNYGQLAINHLKPIFGSPGVWDVFVCNYVQLLKHFDDEDEAKIVLMKYNDDNPNNPNSYKYLYRHLQSTDSPLEEQLPVLERLVDKVPSSEMVLDLHKCLHRLGQKTKAKRVDYKRMSIVILFNMLDHARWQNVLKPWQLLFKHLSKVAKRNDLQSLDTIDGCWNFRKTWWPHFHFRHDQGVAMATSCTELAIYKAIIAGLFLGEDNVFVKAVCTHLPEMADEILQNVQSGHKRLVGDC